MNLKNGKIFTSKFVGTGPSCCEKRIYRTAVSQRLRNTSLKLSLKSVETRKLTSKTKCDQYAVEGSSCIFLQASRVDDTLDSKCEASQKALTLYSKQMSINSNIWKQCVSIIGVRTWQLKENKHIWISVLASRSLYLFQITLATLARNRAVLWMLQQRRGKTSALCPHTSCNYMAGLYRHFLLNFLKVDYFF